MGDTKDTSSPRPTSDAELGQPSMVDAVIGTSTMSLSSVLGLVCLAAALGDGPDLLSRAGSSATTWGSQLSGHVGWSVALWATLLLGGYVLLAGLQRVGGDDEQARRAHVTRDLLILAGLMLPPPLLVTWWAVTSGQSGGLAIALIPTMGVLLALTAQSVTFATFDRSSLRARRENRIRNAEISLVGLPRMGRKAFYVIAAHVVAGAMIGTVLAMLLGLENTSRDLPHTLRCLVAYGVFSTLVAFAFVLGRTPSFRRHNSWNFFYRAVSAAIGVGVSAAVLMGAVLLHRASNLVALVPTLTVIVLLLVSAIITSRSAGTAISSWSLGAAAARIAHWTFMSDIDSTRKALAKATPPARPGTAGGALEGTLHGSS
ncbi:hypothetical protein ACPYO6_14050 [Georgenia sp. Z1344]|uniref:hypothetical protein n=1 Tax=Georgenia sp. Z1344 TaxID=3416706 RepID=UPI003CEBFECC